MVVAGLLVRALKERDSVVAVAVVEEVPERRVQELRVSIRACRFT